MKYFTLTTIIVIVIFFSTIVESRFPKILQEKWGILDSEEFLAMTRIEAKVVGGSDAAPAEAPYQISLLRQGLWSKSHMCGGSLISPSTVVTAAHCTDGQKASSLSIRYGTNKRSQSDYPDIWLSRVVQHKDYDAGTIQNDISLLILLSPITPSSNVGLIEIETEDQPNGTPVTVFGWGLTNGGINTLPENLQRGNLTIVDNKQCNDKWGSFNTITDGMICALDTTQSACNGDSGGPLVSSNGRLTGIVSWGPSRCPPGEYMNVFTRPSYYADWIKKNMI